MTDSPDNDMRPTAEAQDRREYLAELTADSRRDNESDIIIRLTPDDYSKLTDTLAHRVSYCGDRIRLNVDASLVDYWTAEKARAERLLETVRSQR